MLLKTLTHFNDDSHRTREAKRQKCPFIPLLSEKNIQVIILEMFTWLYQKACNLNELHLLRYYVCHARHHLRVLVINLFGSSIFEVPVGKPLM